MISVGPERLTAHDHRGGFPPLIDDEVFKIIVIAGIIGLLFDLLSCYLSPASYIVR